MVRCRYLWLVSATFLALGSPLTTDQSNAGIPDLSKRFKIVLTSQAPSLRANTFVALQAQLVNVSAKPLAVAAGEIGRYVSYQFEPEATDDEQGTIGQGGQSIGDPLPGATPPQLTVIAPGDGISRSLRFPTHSDSMPTRRGEYRVSIDYCHFRALKSAPAPDPTGCVTSNDVVLAYEP